MKIILLIKKNNLYWNRLGEAIHSDRAAQLDDTIIFDNQVSVVGGMSDESFSSDFLTTLIINVSNLTAKKKQINKIS